MHDLFFKKMFGEEGCEDLVTHLLKCILGNLPFSEDTTENNNFQKIINECTKSIADNINLKNIIFLNPNINPDEAGKKGLIMDIKLETDEYLINIESQVKVQANFNMRIFFYITKLYPKDLNSGEDYSELKKVISITLLGEKIKTQAGLHEAGGHISFNFPEDPDKNMSIYHMIQVPRILEISYDLNNKLHRLLIFLYENTPEELYSKVIEMDEVLQKAHHILDTTTKNKEEIAIYEMKLKAEMDYNNNMSSAMKEGIEKGIKEGIEKGIKEGIEKGIKEGRKKGIEEEKIKIALNLKTKDYSLEEIKEITGLSMKEIESLSENAK